MGIKKNFKGASIRKPGVYSFTEVKDDGAGAVTSDGAVLIVGEAEKGAPGDQEGIKTYEASQFGALIAEFGSGPLVDVARAARTPSKTPGVQGAQQFQVWKTNSSLRSSLDLEDGSANPILALKSANWGDSENLINATVVLGSSANKRQITIVRGDESEVLSENAEQAQINIQYTGAGSACTLTISGASLALKTLTTSVTGGPGGEDLSISLNKKSIKDVFELISANPAYTVSLSNSQSGSVTNSTDLDVVTAINVFAAGTELYKNLKELEDIVNSESALATALAFQNVAGTIQVSAKAFFTGAVKGASVTGDFSAGFSAGLAKFWNVVVPAISRDAAADITDGLTDSGSTYDVDSVFAAMSSALILRGTIKNKKEAQGIGGHRDSTIANSYAVSNATASELVQICVEDVLVANSNSELEWQQPHVQAGMMAGIRVGTEPGEPLTNKILNCNGIGHVVNSETGISAGDFDPDTDFDVAIDNGILFAEQIAGGISVVVDNTTYGKDQNFVFNRGSVVEAAQTAAKRLRGRASVSVGKKTGSGLRSSTETALTDELGDLFADEILSPSDDAPQGWKNLLVEVDGNTTSVKVHIKPVQGNDFVLIEIELGNSKTTA